MFRYLRNREHHALACALFASMAWNCSNAQLPSSVDINLSSYYDFELGRIWIHLQLNGGSFGGEVNEVSFTLRIPQSSNANLGELDMLPWNCPDGWNSPCTQSLYSLLPTQTHLNGGYRYKKYGFASNGAVNQDCPCPWPEGVMAFSFSLLASVPVGCSTVEIAHDAYAVLHGLGYRVVLDGADVTGSILGPNATAFPGECQPDTDGDGTPDSSDNCPGIPGQIGSPCNDGDPDTLGDIITTLCTCAGTASPPQGTSFSDVISSSGLPATRGRALVIYDHDNDGLLDVLWMYGQPGERKLMRNNGDLTFMDITSSSSMTSPTAAFPVAGRTQSMDVDNNGWTDLIETYYPTNTLRVQLNSGGLLEAQEILLPLDIDGTPEFLDLDRNGTTDLLFTARHADGQLYLDVVMNDLCASTPESPFQNFVTIAGPLAAVSPLPHVFDYDQDGDMDILVVMGVASAYNYSPIKLFRNDQGTFTDATSGSGLGLGHGMGCNLWDPDNDGDLDLTFGTYDCCVNPNVARTYLNNGNGTFTDVSSTIVLKSGNNYFQHAMTADIENDGDEDVYWAMGAWGNSQLYINDGGTFGGNVASACGLSLGGGTDGNGASTGIQPCWFDADNDGDLDVLCGTHGSNGNAKLMVNPVRQTSAANSHYLAIEPRGCGSGRSAANATVTVYTAGSADKQIAGNFAAEYASTRPLERLHFGLGSATSADSVVTHWPSGATTRYYNVQADQLLVIEETPGCVFSDCIGAPPGNRVAVHVMLEGAMRQGSPLMGDELRTAGILPLEEPYAALGYFHIGDGGDEETTPTVLAVTGPNAIVDWVVVELRDPDYNGFRASSRSALLQRDGDVVDMDGVSPVAFTAPTGNYFLAIKHRNHLGVMTATPITFGPGPLTLDFTAASTAAFGTNALKTVGGRRCLWTGDATFNGQMKYTGAANDRDPILVRVGSTSPNNTVSGYFREDTNMDGLVKYTGSGNDRDPILLNVGSTTPNGVRNGQVP